MKSELAVCAVLATAVLASSGHAASITNTDGQSYTITVLSGDNEQIYALKPSASVDLSKDCGETCALVMPSGDEYDIVAGDTYSIEQGLLFLEPPAQGSGEPEATPGKSL